MKNRINIFVALICAIALTTVSTGVVSAAEDPSQISYNSKGVIVFDNGTTDTSDDVRFDASDFATIQQVVVDGKNKLRDTLNSYSTVSLSGLKTFDELNAAINNISAGSNATANQILSGQKALVGKNLITGEMPNNGSWSSSVAVSNYRSSNKSTDVSISVPNGYHNGSGKVTTPSFTSLTAEDAAVSAANEHVLSSKKAWVNGNEIVGTMPNNGAWSSSNVVAGASVTIPKGYHDGTGKIVTATLASQTQANAAADTILSTKTAWVNGNKITGSMPNNGNWSSSGLTAGNSISIPKGYHDGTGKVTAKDLASQTSGTAAAGNILNGKIAWVNGSKVTGTMTDQGAKSTTLLAGQTYTIPAGYHNGSGVITAKDLASQTQADAVAGNILSGKTAWVKGSKVTGTMTNNGAVAPAALTAGNSYVIPAGYHNGSGKVTAASLASQTGVQQGYSAATAANILSGTQAWVNGSRITGTMVNRGKVTQTLNAGSSYTIPAGYHDGTGTVTANSLASQTSGTAAAGDILSNKTAYVNGVQVTGTMTNQGAKSSTLNAGGSYTIPAGYHNGSGVITAASLASQTSADAAAGNILSGKTAWVNGSKVTGTMANKGALNVTVNPGATQSVTAGYYSGGTITGGACTQTHLVGETLTVTPGTTNQEKTPSSGKNGFTKVTVTGDADLLAENIKKDVEIFGVTGTLNSSTNVFDESARRQFSKLAPDDYDMGLAFERAEYNYVNDNYVYSTPSTVRPNYYSYDGTGIKTSTSGVDSYTGKSREYSLMIPLVLDSYTDSENVVHTKLPRTYAGAGHTLSYWSGSTFKTDGTDIVDMTYTGQKSYVNDFYKASFIKMTLYSFNPKSGNTSTQNEAILTDIMEGKTYTTAMGYMSWNAEKTECNFSKNYDVTVSLEIYKQPNSYKVDKVIGPCDYSECISKDAWDDANSKVTFTNRIYDSSWIVTYSESSKSLYIYPSCERFDSVDSFGSAKRLDTQKSNYDTEEWKLYDADYASVGSSVNGRYEYFSKSDCSSKSLTYNGRSGVQFKYNCIYPVINFFE